MKKISVTGTIEKIVRQASKENVQITMTVPAKMAEKIPLGAVVMDIESKQGKMFEEGN